MLMTSNSHCSTPIDNTIKSAKSPTTLFKRDIRQIVWLIFVSALLLTLGGCASFKPVPMDQVPFKDRTQMQETEDLIVSVAVLSNEEAAQVFGLPLSKQGVQPVWLQIENKSTQPYVLLTGTIDFDYFTPYEIAYPHHGTFSGETNKKIDQFLHDQHFDWHIKPGETNSGFVYTNLEPGFKYINIGIFAPHNYQTFQFTAQVPGIVTDYSNVDFDSLYAEEDYIELDDDGLRNMLEKFPCCTTNADGSGDGDPLNLVVIGADKETGYAFGSRDWYVTETIRGGTVWKTIKSSVFGSQYKTSPVSSLYVFGRPQDIALQKARKTVDERNHLRLWLTPWLYQGRNVWIGQISRDIGVKFTLKSPTISTHKVDADVDEARNFLVQDLAFSYHLEKIGWVKGVGKVTLDEDVQNLTGDAYFTDGLRAVLVMTKDIISIKEIKRFDWERVIEHRDKK